MTVGTVEFQMPTKFTMGKLVSTENLAYRVTIFDSTTLYMDGVSGFSQDTDTDTVRITVTQPNVGQSGTITAEVEAILMEEGTDVEDTASTRASVPDGSGVEITPGLLGMISLGSVGTVTVQVSSFAS